MQVLSDESVSDAPLPPPAGSHAGAAPSAATNSMTSRRRRQSTFIVLLVVALAGGGLVAGAALGTRAPARYQADITVQVDRVMAFEPWEANLETARFAQALLRTDLHEQTADTVGLTVGDFSEIEATHEDSSPIVQVKMIVDDADAASNAVTELVDETLRSLSASDSVPHRLIVDELTPQLDAANAAMATMWEQADVAPGTNLTDTYNQARYNLETATAEQKVATEQWRLDQLPGLIAAAESTVNAIEPLLDQWYQVSSTVTDLRARVDPALNRLQALSLGLDVLETGGHRSAVTVAEVSQTRSIARWAAGGAAIGIAAALALLGLLSLRSPRRRA